MIIHIRGGGGGGEGGIVQNNANITQTMHTHKQNTKKKIHSVHWGINSTLFFIAKFPLKSANCPSPHFLGYSPLYITPLTPLKIGFLSESP